MNALYMNNLQPTNFLTEDHTYKRRSWTINTNHVQVMQGKELPNETSKIRIQGDLRTLYNIYLLPSNTTTLINIPITGRRYITYVKTTCFGHHAAIIGSIRLKHVVLTYTI